MRASGSTTDGAWPPASPARFVPLQSANHLILDSEPAYARFIEEIASFLKG
jgi:hypothetical protein